LPIGQPGIGVAEQSMGLRARVARANPRVMAAKEVAVVAVPVERFPLPRRVAAIGSVKGPVATEQLGPLALESLTQPVSLSGKVLRCRRILE